MLQVDVDQRCTAAQVLDHRWVNVSSAFKKCNQNHLCRTGIDQKEASVGQQVDFLKRCSLNCPG